MGFALKSFTHRLSDFRKLHKTLTAQFLLIQHRHDGEGAVLRKRAISYCRWDSPIM